MKKYVLKIFLSNERGQALLIVLVLLLFGSLTITPVLSHVGTALKSTRVYEDKAGELYAADAGIEDALWQIKYEYLESLLTESPAYDPYDFATTWDYNLSEQVNSLDTTIYIENTWIPYEVSPLSAAEARDIIETGKLMVAGNATSESGYEIKISFFPGEGEEDDLMVESLGVWLPHGFSYVEGSSNLEDDPFDEYYSVPEIEPYAGGQAVVWSFESVPFADFPGANPLESPILVSINFEYTSSQPGSTPESISWMTTSGVSDVPISWDADTRVFRVTAVAGDTEIEAYSVNCRLRKLGTAINGDYLAIGNSLMTDDNHDNYREHWHSESSTTVSDVPNNTEDGFADVVAAYLYWSGWQSEGTAQPIWEDDCSDYSDWNNPANDWGLSSGSFIGHHVGSAPDDHRYLEMKNSLDLTTCPSGMAKVVWEHWEEDGWQLESSDALKFQFSGDGGENWSSMYTAFHDDIGSTPHYFSYTIPDAYLTDNFTFRFYLQNFGGDEENCYVDNFAVVKMVFIADTTAVFKIDDVQVYLDGEGQPQTGIQDVTASKTQVLPNYDSEGDPNGFSYACYLDVTKLVKEYAEMVEDEHEEEHHTGNAKYTVGDVAADTDNMWSYAGWSLIIIYSSPETAGHQLYLYDDFMYADEDTNIDFDGDGEEGGDITGFVVPEQIWGEPNTATLTCFVAEGDSYTGDTLKFTGQSGANAYLSNSVSPWNNVWNSHSPGVSYDGVDIDTFYITWASGLLEPGDSSAHMDLETATDSWNLVYIILSMRSETVIGGTVHYVIHYN
jgi:hypothetical protein